MKKLAVTAGKPTREVRMPLHRSAPVSVRLGKAACAILVIASAGLLAGCGNMHKDSMTTGAVDDYRTRHPITLTDVEHTLDVPVSSGDRRLTTGMKDAIAGFAAEYASSASGIVQILLPQGSPNSGAAHQVRKEIRAVLTRSGVPSPRIVETSYQADASGDAAPIRLSYVAMTAVTNQCGEWPEDLANDTLQNRNYHNFGCASQNNLAAQISSPMDLLTPRKMSPIDATQRANVISDYRTNITTGSSD
ncbi:CpaD family pilus assembly protein [Agrobacterium sp. ES01]|uniref:CpaD family pilus assembly protein n=1 Tax=Agrobacterium sp. ES01 TaxID=3420714 RepID=UPI003D104215